jgi:Tfp pilus assembly protein PilN
MFTIDLLKGQGIPIKRRPWGVAIAALAFVVPILVAMVMFGFYISNGIVIRVSKQEIANYETNTKALADAVKLQESLETEKSNLNNCLSELASSFGKHTQWTPILVTVVENLPPSMILTKLDTKLSATKKKIPSQNDPKKMVDVSTQINTLEMSLSSRTQANCDKAVKDFMDSLRSSAVIAPRLVDITVSQKAGSFEGQETTSYYIDCIFKSEL